MDIDRVIPRLLLRDPGGVDSLVLLSGAPALALVRTEPPVARLPNLPVQKRTTGFADGDNDASRVSPASLAVEGDRCGIRPRLECAGRPIGVLLASDGDGAIELSI